MEALSGYAGELHGLAAWSVQLCEGDFFPSITYIWFFAFAFLIVVLFDSGN